MSVLIVSLNQGVPIAQTVPALYATIIGSNMGALLTPIGALAGIMWMTMLKGKEFSLSFGDFFKICLLHTPIVLGVSLGMLALITCI